MFLIRSSDSTLKTLKNAGSPFVFPPEILTSLSAFFPCSHTHFHFSFSKHSHEGKETTLLFAIADQKVLSRSSRKLLLDSLISSQYTCFLTHNPPQSSQFALQISIQAQSQRTSNTDDVAYTHQVVIFS